MKIKKKLVFFLALSALISFCPAVFSAEERKTEPGVFNQYISIQGDEVSVLEPEEVPTYDASELEQYQKENTVYQVTGEKGIQTFHTYAEAVESTVQNSRGMISPRSLAGSDVTIIENTLTYGTDVGVVIFKNTVSTLTYTNKNTGASTYIAPTYAPEAAYLGIDGNTITFRQGGCTGTTSKDNAYVMDYQDFKNAGYVTSVYRVQNGKIYHYITTDLRTYSSFYTIGYQQSYMTDGAEYYSFDGHYFYTAYDRMVKDYISGSHQNAINPDNPYYSYYQYLSHRTKTNYTAQQIDEYLAMRTASSSKLRGMGEALISNQNTYGANAMLMLGLSINESGWGMSQLAQDKNNLFGHGAVDSNPYYGANGYASPAESIHYHAQYFVSRGYLDPTDYRYFGPHLGDKNSGMNVKYASDPYWGEKAAAQVYFFNDYYENSDDVNRYTILICDGDQKVYTKPSAAGYFYSTGNGSQPYPTLDFPFTVLEQTSGDSVGDSNVWYKIATDPDLKDDRSGFIIRDDGTYHPENSYGYVHASQVRTLVSKQQTIPEPEPELIIIRGGDLNGDGKVNASDGVLYSRYLAKWDIQIDLSQADLNQDGEYTAKDIVLLQRYLSHWKNYILNP